MNITEPRRQINQYLDRLSPEQLHLVLGFLAGIAPESGQTGDRTKSRAELIRLARGKYAHLPGSSEEFARRKLEEIDLEDKI